MKALNKINLRLKKQCKLNACFVNGEVTHNADVSCKNLLIKWVLSKGQKQSLQ